MRGDLGPGADAHAVGLGDAAVAGERVGGRIAVGPDALLEGAAQLGQMRVADEVVALVVERGVEEEAVVLQLEVLAVLADAALAEGEELLALGERTDGDRPFLEGNWHGEVSGGRGRTETIPRRGRAGGLRQRDCNIVANRGLYPQTFLQPNTFSFVPVAALTQSPQLAGKTCAPARVAGLT